MLNLKSIRKDYVTASETVHALKGVSISFRKTEFVSILGPSGCGKTTLLNIIGGLDHYTDGDLMIGGRSTKEYTDRDWDVYRNHRVGFIFQSYNLIPHQTILGNVELALTIAGISREERIARAKNALDRVGLADQYYKKPNQLSGGQCQRVAIARALVNNPEILLADEPTGALDTNTSVQIMELIKEISKERLVVMVTHNPELADEYSTRIVRLLDGEIIEDSNPMTDEEVEAEIRADEAEKAAELAEIEALPEEEKVKAVKKLKKKKEKAKMSFFTAFMLSLRNLFTKKGRTALTAFAGSIGIIGIALILAVSEGTTAYINHVQETTLSAYPLTLESSTVDISALMESFMNKDDEITHDKDAVYKDPIIAELVEALSKVEQNDNDLASFKAFLDRELADENSELSKAVMGVQYTYNIDMNIYTKDPATGDIVKSDTGELMSKMLEKYIKGLISGGNLSTSDNKSYLDFDKEDDEEQSSGSQGGSFNMMSAMMGVKLWEEMLPGPKDRDGNQVLINDVVKQQYDVVHGKWPTAANEIVLVLNENNEIDDLTLHALGLLSEADMDAIIESAINQVPLADNGKNRWTYEQICDLTFRTIFPYNFFEKTADGTYKSVENDELKLRGLYESKSYELKIVGIIRPNEETETAMLSGTIAYTHALTEHVINEALNSPVVKDQLANLEYDVLTGLPFSESTKKMTDAEKAEAFKSYIGKLSPEMKKKTLIALMCIQTEETTLSGAIDQAWLSLCAKDEHGNPIMENNEIVLTPESIIAALTNPDAGFGGDLDLNIDEIAPYLEGASSDALKNMLKPLIVNVIREGIYNNVSSQVEAMGEQTIATFLNTLVAADAEDTATLAKYYDNATQFSKNSYDEVLVKIGCVDLDTPYTINLYASTFENKDVIVAAIANYNESMPEEQKIAYTDFLGIMMSSITTIINAISYVLIAFVSISLIVSSIMIGVITLISVQERTKEIGVLRAIGASKRDVSSMFNAETVIIGLASGLLGVTVTYLLCIPINLILHALTGIKTLSAILPIGAAAILVLISVLLTLFAGFIPSRSAAKKDPVVALRTE